MKKSIFYILILNMVVFANTLVVDNNPTCDKDNKICYSCKGTGNTNYYKTIKDAINNTANGDTIEICKGTYKESILIDKKDLTIKGVDGQSIDDVVVKNTDPSFTLKILVKNDNGLTIQNLKVINDSSSGYAIWADGNTNGKISLIDLIVKSKNVGLYFDKGFSELNNVTVKSKNVAVQSVPTVNVTINNAKINSTNDKGIYFGSGENINISIKNSEISAKKNSILIDKASNVLIDSIKIEKGQGVRLSGNVENYMIKNSIIKSTKNKDHALTTDAKAGNVINTCFYGKKLIYDFHGNYEGNYYNGVNDIDNNKKITSNDSNKIDGNVLDSSFVTSCKKQDSDISSNLIAEYRMDECSWDGTVGEVKDSSGNNFNATAKNGTDTDIGKLCMAAKFDGSDDYVELPSFSGDKFKSGLTISAWVKFDRDNSGWWDRIVDLANGPHSDNILFARNGATNNLTFEIYNGSSSCGKITATDGIIPGEMHHYVATIDENRNVKIYRDGSIIGSGTSSCLPKDVSRAKNYIAKSNWGSDAYFKGKMDEVKIYNKALSDKDILFIYNNEKDKKNWDGTGRTCSSCMPSCNLQNGLKLSTYDISDYSQHYPNNHEDYDALENDYAVKSKLFGSGIVDNIDINSLENNNPYYDGKDEKYLSIFDGYIYIPEDGSYSFAVNGDDAVEVIIDDAYYGWYGGHGIDSTSHNEKFVLKKGYHKLKFRHQEWLGGDNYQLYWKKPGDNDYSIVPKDNLFYCAPPKPIAEYRMDECSWDGTVGEVKDSSGNNYNATVYGDVTKSDGQMCQGASYYNKDASNYIRVNNKIQRHGSEEITIMGWINVYGHTGKWANIWHLSPDDNDYTTNSRQPALFLNNDDNTHLHSVNDGVNNRNLGIYSTFGTITYGKWHHVVQVITKRLMKIYIDGVLTDTYNAREDFKFNDGYFYIGDKWNSKNMKIDEVKIYNKALSDKDILFIYNNEKDKKNWDGTGRTCSGCMPSCNLQNGLKLSTYDISNYSQRYPNNHEDYDTLENNYAVKSKLFGTGIVDNIDINSLENNNPYYDGKDEKYLSIFDGYIYIPEDGSYSFAVNGDDAVEVIIDDAYYGWYGGHGIDSTSHNEKFVLKKGYHKLKFRHQEWLGGDNYQLYWKKPGDNDYSIVPKDNLFYCAPPKPIAEYRMDECSWDGTVGEVKDSSGNNFNATAKNGADISYGKLCNSGSFDGDNDYVELQEMNTSYSNGFSISAWVKFERDGNGKWERIIDLGNGSPNNNILFARNETSNSITFEIYNNNSSCGKITANDGIIPGEIHQYVATINKDKHVKIYRDGIEIASGTSSCLPNDVNRKRNYIGKSSWGSDAYFKGLIDEVKIYDQALSDEDILLIYNNEKDSKNWDGTGRICQGCMPTCDLQKGLRLSTYDTKNYIPRFPKSHQDYDALENNYAIESNLFGKGVVGNIDTKGLNNNPYHDGVDDYYLSIFEGYIYIPEDGNYSFAVNGDDAVEVIIDNAYYGWYGDHSIDSTDHNYEFMITKGYHKLRFRHQEAEGLDSYQLYWKRPGDSDYSIVPKENLFYCYSPDDMNIKFNAVSSIEDLQCNAQSDWDRNLTTQIVSKEFPLYILAKDENNSANKEANITKVELFYYKDYNNDNRKCSGISYYSEVICDDSNPSKMCNDTSSNGCVKLPNIKISQAVKCVRVYIEGKDINSTSDDVNESNATDVFAVRPEKFKIEAPSVVFAGEDFNLTFSAIEGKDYNESNESFEVNITSINNCVKDRIDTGWSFSDGAYTYKNAKFTNVGEINITIREINGSEFAKVDRYDTNDSDRRIDEYTTTIKVYPYKLRLKDPQLKPITGSNEWLYMANDLSKMSAEVNVTIDALTKDSTLINDFNETCYGNEVSEIDLEFKYNEDKVEDDISYSKLYDGNKSSANIYGDVIKVPLSAFQNGEANISYKIGIDRNWSNPINPVELNLTSVSIINANDNNKTGKERENLDDINENVVFYYGRVKFYNIRTRKDEAPNAGYFLVYSTNKDRFVGKFPRYSVNWYINTMHTKQDGKIDKAEAHKNTRMDSTKLDNIEISSIDRYIGGTVDINITNKNKERTKAFIHLDINSSEWLWYGHKKFSSDYSFDEDSDCTNHPCFRYVYIKPKSKKRGVLSGTFHGSDFDINVTTPEVRRGTKIFR